MSAVTEKVSFPKMHSVEMDGWTLTIRCKGVYTKCVNAVAISGEPKGSISLDGHGMKVSIGRSWRWHSGIHCFWPSWQFPINLSRGQELTRQLGEELRNKYNKEPNWEFLMDLCQEAFQPYIRYYIR